MANLRVEARFIVTMDPQRRVRHDAALVAEEGRIVAIDRAEVVRARFPHADRVMRGDRLLVLPGFVNCHTHLFQVLLRGIGADMTLGMWLEEAMFPILRHLQPRHVRAGAQLGCLENLRSGVTTVVDNHHVCTGREATEAVGDALLQSGLRGVVARGMADATPWARAARVPKFLLPFDAAEEARLTEALIRRWRRRGQGRVTICPAPVASVVASEALLRACTQLARRYRVPVHMHVAESRFEVEESLRYRGCREVEYLAKRGFLREHFHVVHGVWVTPDELRLMAAQKADLVHCPISNMYLASGVAPIPTALRLGVNVALGTDGPASNNSHNMFETMKAAALVQKAVTLEPHSVTALQALEMATLGGARALGLDRQIGSLQVGKRADFVALELSHGFGTPVHDPVSTVVYALGVENVATVVVDGAVVWQGGSTQLAEEEVLRGAERAAADLVSRVP